MKRMVGMEALQASEGGSSVAIGTFDGVHLGHRGLIMATLEQAEREGAEGIVLTWDRHPAQTLRPERTPPLLTSPERKIELLESTGVGTVAVLPFDASFAALGPQDFVERVLVRGLNARVVFVGSDWRFGHKAAGTTELLQELGDAHGFSVVPAPLQTVGGEVVSSSRIRAVIASGDMEQARVLLGRPYDLDGIVVRGAARGKDLGFPTANLDVPASLARPPLGVYAGVARVSLLTGTATGSVTRVAAISIGVNPTFTAPGSSSGEPAVSVEAYLLDHDEDIYGATVRLEFWHRLRDEMRFDSVPALVEQMHRDVAETRTLIGSAFRGG